jgi:hypothetical protein
MENVFLKQEERLSSREEEENNESEMKQSRDIKEEGDHMIVSEEPPSNLVSLWIPCK